MPISSPRLRRLWKLFTVLWAVFLLYGPLCIFVAERFHWQLLAVNGNALFDGTSPLAASWLCALATAVALLFRAPLKAILPAVIFFLDCLLIFSPLSDALEVKSFADFSKPESVYVERHCAPMNFVQDGKAYVLGICNLKIDHDGLDDFDLIYDTSGDIGNYNKLDQAARRTFAMAIRRYYNDDPNEGFEYADFTASRYYRGFFTVEFDQAETEGFTASYGKPPQNPKSAYAPIF